MDMNIKEHIDKMKNDPDYKIKWKEEQEIRIKEYWNEIKPFQFVEDVPELPNPLTDFFINKLVELGAIPKCNLEDGEWYYGNYRNTKFGKWNKKTEKFDHYRWKFELQKDDCNHFQDDDRFALFVPLRKVNEQELVKIKKTEEEYERK